MCVSRVFRIIYLRHTITPITIPRAHSTYYPMSIRQMLSTGAWARALSLNTAQTHTHTHTLIIVIIIIIIKCSNIPPKVGIYY